MHPKEIVAMLHPLTRKAVSLAVRTVVGAAALTLSAGEPHDARGQQFHNDHAATADKPSSRPEDEGEYLKNRAPVHLMIPFAAEAAFIAGPILSHPDFVVQATMQILPYSPMGHVRLGLDRIDKADLDGAIAEFDEAARLDPQCFLALDNRARVWSRRKEFAKAIVDFDRAIRCRPDVAATYRERGLVWLCKKEYDKAIADFGEAVRLDPECFDAFIDRGGAWLDKKEYDKAIADLN
jgi:tetratricopeptide (TPR) repeat protein